MNMSVCQAYSEIKMIKFGAEKIEKSQIEDISKKYFKKDFKTLDNKTKKEIVDQIIEMKIVLAEAREEGLDRTEDFKEKIGLITDLFLLKEYAQRELSAIKISEGDIEKYYAENENLFKGEREVNVSHILVKTKTEADFIITELNNSNTPKALFAELAKKFSKDFSGDGGSLGWFGKGKMVPEFEAASFGLKKGEYTRHPIKTQFGYHIIYANDSRQRGDITYDNFKNKLLSDSKAMDGFKQKVLEKRMYEKLQNLRKTKYKINIID